MLLLCEPPEPFEPELEEPELDPEFEPEFEHCPCEASAGETATGRAVPSAFIYFGR